MLTQEKAPDSTGIRGTFYLVAPFNEERLLRTANEALQKATKDETEKLRGKILISAKLKSYTSFYIQC